MESLSPSGGMLVGDFHVAWSVTQVSLQANAVQGMLFTAGLAFLVLLLSTCNWLLSLYAMLGVVGVISSVFLVVNLLGWEFGIPEALALIVIIGFSVDYVLHIGTHYVSAVGETRKAKTQLALGEIAVSVLGGGVTTFGVAVALLFATFQLFFRFGVFIGLTVPFSLLYALLFFTALLHTAGP